jgi:hypothetical protein
MKLPDRIWVERDPETNEKRWYSIKGTGEEYVRLSQADPMSDREEMVALADELDSYCEKYSGDWSNALPPMSWQQLQLITQALRSAAQAEPGYVAGFEACREAALAAVKSRRWSEETKATTNGARTYGNEEACDFIAAAIAALPAPATAAAGEEVTVLADAMWQLLDDMGARGQSVCLAAKAQARLAYEPFRDKSEEYDDWMPVEEARRIMAECEMPLPAAPTKRSAT